MSKECNTCSATQLYGEFLLNFQVRLFPVTSLANLRVACAKCVTLCVGFISVAIHHLTFSEHAKVKSIAYYT